MGNAAEGAWCSVRAWARASETCARPISHNKIHGPKADFWSSVCASCRSNAVQTGMGASDKLCGATPRGGGYFGTPGPRGPSKLPRGGPRGVKITAIKEQPAIIRSATILCVNSSECFGPIVLSLFMFSSSGEACKAPVKRKNQPEKHQAKTQ